MNTNDTQTTHTQLLVYIASMVLRIQSQQRHLQTRLQVLESTDPSVIEFVKKCFGIESAKRLTELELEGFGEQFPDLLRFATEYSELSESHFCQGVTEAAAKACQSGPSKDGAAG